jgi:UDP-N-acetylglucosamine 2-epimerase
MQYTDGSRPLLAHIEAGLRSGDRSMPEEVNRVLTDAISDVFFTTEESAEANLRRENVPGERIHFVGNVMIDCLLNAWPHIEERRAWADLGLARHAYGLVTLYRRRTLMIPTCFRESSRISPASRAGCRWCFRFTRERASA